MSFYSALFEKAKYFLCDLNEKLIIQSFICIELQCLQSTSYKKILKMNINQGKQIKSHDPLCRLSHTPLTPHRSLSLRPQQVWGGSGFHPDQIWGSEQEEGHQGDLHPLHVRHRHQERAVCVRRRHRRHHQEQPEGLWPLLITCLRKSQGEFRGMNQSGSAL